MLNSKSLSVITANDKKKNVDLGQNSETKQYPTQAYET